MKIFPASAPRRAAAFTMVEIAICLGVIGFALVAIVGVLPLGMNAQRQNREQTIVNQDFSVFIEAMRNGARGVDDLTNYVVAITNTVQAYDVVPSGATFLTNPAGSKVVNAYFFNDAREVSPGNAQLPFRLTNGQNIIGLMSTPKYTLRSPNGFYSNSVFTYVRALSGISAEKAPLKDTNLQSFAFNYRVSTEIVPVPMAVSAVPSGPNYRNIIRTNLHEVRLNFRWPVIPGGVGNNKQTFRTLVGGEMYETNYAPGQSLFFFRPTIYSTNAP